MHFIETFLLDFERVRVYIGLQNMTAFVIGPQNLMYYFDLYFWNYLKFISIFL